MKASDKPIKGIVFDLDGTLVDSPLCFKSIRRQLKIPEGEFILEYLEHLPIEERQAKHRDLEEMELVAARQAVPFPGVLSLLEEIRSRQISVGIFTRNCRRATHHIVRAHGMTVDLIVTREDAPPKPDPSGLVKFLEHWKLETSELLYVGDFRFDVECGKKVGVRTALFTNGSGQQDELNPDYMISDYASFWDCL